MMRVGSPCVGVVIVAALSGFGIAAEQRSAGAELTPQGARSTIINVVTKIQRADYEGDRGALKQLHAELTPFVAVEPFATRVLYWRGFAMWRRALNGFNDAADPKEIQADLAQCVVDFRDALARDASFVDAKIGAASCLVNDSFLNRKSNPSRATELLVESMSAFREAQAVAPANPRLLWVQGANEWYAPPGRGGGQSTALATYQRGLELARQQKGRSADPLEPAWGEPELLMNLAFANLNRSIPDVKAAERYARAALEIVPYWHYVRNILLPQILKSKDGW